VRKIPGALILNIRRNNAQILLCFPGSMTDARGAGMLDLEMSWGRIYGLTAYNSSFSSGISSGT
jgi:hypothetical protein